MRGAVAERSFELVTHHPLGRQQQASLGDGRTGNIAAQPEAQGQ